MIDKLIDKYRETIRASKEIVEEQRQQRFSDEVTIRSEITRFCVYEMVIQDLEELKEKRKNETLQSQLDIANKKLDKIDTFIRGHQLFGMRFAKTLYRECLEYILSIIGGNNE